MEYQSTREDQKSQSLTVYMNGFGAVKEVRQLMTDVPVAEVKFMDVADKIEMDSIVIHGLEVLEYSYDYDFISKKKLLEKYIGEVVTVQNRREGYEVKFRLLSISEGLIGERIDTKEILIDPDGELVLPPFPGRFPVKPALVLKVTPTRMDREVHISYLTQGIGWTANYVFEVNGKTLALSSWIVLQNGSGINFVDAKLKLIAGEANRYKHSRPVGEGDLLAADFLVQPTEESQSGDAHMYTLEHPITVLNEQTKQIKFMEIEGVAFRKIYKLRAASKRPAILLELENRIANQLGVPLPKGLVKVYEIDAGGDLEFTGEDAIEHIPTGEKIELHIGEAFDIVTESREKKREQHGSFEYVMIEYELKNHKKENIRVDIEHFIFDRLWKMESSSHDYEIINSSKVEFRVRIAAGKTVKVEFTYKIDKRHGI